MIKVRVNGQNKQETQAVIDRDPDECPMCHRSLAVSALSTFTEISVACLQGVYQCPSITCHRLFIATFLRNPNSGHMIFHQSLPLTPIERPLDPKLKDVSSEFVETYQQSWRAKQLGMLKIAGTGFRRALEFLVKDYACRDLSDPEKDAVRQKSMVQCIRDHIQEDGIKTVAERAAWLGNDETHYLRKWEDKDINDLIDLVDSVGAWIVIHLKTEQLKSSMPKGLSNS
jgi:hypothetical protein